MVHTAYFISKSISTSVREANSRLSLHLGIGKPSTQYVIQQNQQNTPTYPKYRQLLLACISMYSSARLFFYVVFAYILQYCIIQATSWLLHLHSISKEDILTYSYGKTIQRCKHKADTVTIYYPFPTRVMSGKKYSSLLMHRQQIPLAALQVQQHYKAIHRCIVLLHSVIMKECSLRALYCSVVCMKEYGDITSSF